MESSSLKDKFNHLISFLTKGALLQNKVLNAYTEEWLDPARETQGRKDVDKEILEFIFELQILTVDILQYHSTGPIKVIRKIKDTEAQKTVLANPENILEEANRIVSGDRRDAYGDAYTACRRVAWMWEAILNAKVRPEDVALMMVCFKVVREAGKHSRDNVVDIAGYARVLEMVLDSKTRNEKAEHGKEEIKR